ncbi:hypothetical protein HXX01_00360 [Candidatus Nomurabacteria bacterium]|nr:hypothetical protein [Candidatus Nomurabacteria bacterium]
MKINKKIYAIGTLAILATLIGGVSAFAESNTQGGPEGGNQGNRLGQMRRGGDLRPMMKPAVVGQVTAINGNIITITSKQVFDRNNNGTTPTPTTTTFTVDATNAKIEKGGATVILSNIIVGDTIMVQGTVTGTNVVATNIRDGIARGQEQNKEKGNQSTDGQIPANMQGNGLPIVAGSVTSITGNSVVITNKSNVTYTIDATSAKIVKGTTTGTITNIAVGDQILAQGNINGNNVVATSIYDQVNQTTKNAPKAKGIFSKIGSFFGRLFGF